MPQGLIGKCIAFQLMNRTVVIGRVQAEFADGWVIQDPRILNMQQASGGQQIQFALSPVQVIPFLTEPITEMPIAMQQVFVQCELDGDLVAEYTRSTSGIELPRGGSGILTKS